MAWAPGRTRMGLHSWTETWPPGNVSESSFECHDFMRLCFEISAPLVAEAFRTDPEVAELLDPAVFVGADEEDCAAAVVERIQLAEVMSGVQITEEESAQEDSLEGAPIAVLVMDRTSTTFLPRSRSEDRSQIVALDGNCKWTRVRVTASAARSYREGLARFLPAKWE